MRNGREKTPDDPDDNAPAPLMPAPPMPASPTHADRLAMLSNPAPLYVAGLFSMGYADFYIFLMPLYQAAEKVTICVL